MADCFFTRGDTPLGVVNITLTDADLDVLLASTVSHRQPADIEETEDPELVAEVPREARERVYRWDGDLLVEDPTAVRDWVAGATPVRYQWVAESTGAASVTPVAMR